MIVRVETELRELKGNTKRKMVILGSKSEINKPYHVI